MQEVGAECPWQVEAGPLPVSIRDCLNPSGWSLLIHQIDGYVPNASHIFTQASFVPRWLLDDVMLSIAPPDGSVGPHIDHYDAFLVQVEGRRRWQLEATPQPDGRTLVEGADLAVLADFEPDQELILEPGDVLYVPRGLAHHGIAIDAAQTWSVGLRAPTPHDLALTFVEEMLENLPFDVHYCASDHRTQENQAELRPENVRAFWTLIDEVLEPKSFESWLGRYLTVGREQNWERLPEQRHDISDPKCIRVRLRRDVRSAYVNHPNGGLSLFLGGEEYRVPMQAAVMARKLANGQSVDIGAETEGAITELLTTLDNRTFLLHH